MADLFVMRCGTREKITNRENSQSRLPSIHQAHGNRQLERRIKEEELGI